MIIQILKRAILGALCVPLMVAGTVGCGSDASGAGGAGSSSGTASSSTGGPYDPTKCASASADPMACLACCETDLPGKSRDDYFDDCIAEASCGACIPTCLCNGSQEDADCTACMQFPGGEVVTECEENTCRYFGDDPSAQAACESRVACEYQCTCERCGGTGCVDLKSGSSDGQGNVFHCGSCDVTCTDNVYCIEGQCQCPPDLPYCGPQ